MKILLSNDDGVFAPGIKALYETLSEIAEVVVVAPDRDRSAASKSLTLKSPIRARKLDNGFYSIDGTPTDCVHYAVMELMKDDKPDMIVAGINAGANLGDDVLYSGTVSVATEGRFLGYPGIAVSLAYDNVLDEKSYAAAAKITQSLVKKILVNSLQPGTILNINVPDPDIKNIKGIKTTRLGQRHQSEGMLKMKDPRGEDVYWIGPCGNEQDAGPGTDFHAINNKYVSVTPLDIDLTKHDALSDLNNWLEGFECS